MSNSPLLYTDSHKLGWQDFIGTRDVITWAPLKFSTSDYATVTKYSSGYCGCSPSTIDAVTVGDIEHDYIRKVFRELDKLLEPEFLETNPEDADIILMGLLPPNEKMGLGGGHFHYMTPYPKPSARGPKIGYSAWYESTGKNNLDQWEMGTILHEIGHALFLDHPMGNGPHPDFNKNITIMSYNKDPKVGHRRPVWYRDLDIHTLQDIWGKESNPEPADWPATESFPAVIDHLPYTPPVVVSPIIEKSNSAKDTNLSQAEIDDIVESANTISNSESTFTTTTDDFKAISQRKIENQTFKISKKIQNKWWAKKIHKRIGGDKEMEVYIHHDGEIIGSKEIQKQGKPDAVSQVEMDFMVDLLNDIDKMSGLDIKLVNDYSSADAVIMPMKMKKWGYYLDVPLKKPGPWHFSWGSDGKDGMTTQEKNWCAQIIFASVGLKELKKKDRKKYTTFHTQMSWNDDDYYGFTQADEHALVSLWGEA